MRLRLMFTAAAAVSFIGFSAAAQDGQYRDGLQRMITETASGTCPTDVMAEDLLAACQQQIAQMGPGLASLGDVVSITFVEAQDGPQGRIETYEVKFANGQSLTWAIGGFENGKFNIAYTAG